MLSFILTFISGIITGLVSSFLPGVHINTVAAVFSDVLSSESVLIGVGIFSVLGVVPAIVMGVPDSDTLGSYFPIQRVMAQGNLKKGIVLIVVSAFFSSVLAVIALNFVPGVVELSYNYIKQFIPLILAMFILHSLIRGTWADRRIIILSSVLGFIIFNLPVSDVLLPLFAGLFAMPALASCFSGTSYPKQKPEKITFDYKFIFIGVLLGLAAALLPAVSSPAQLAVVASPILASTDSFLILSTSIIVSKYFFALPMKTCFGKARAGAYTGIQIPHLGWIYLLFGVMLGAALLYIIFKKIEKIKISRHNLKLLSLCLIVYLCLVTILLQGVIGLFVLFSASCLGFHANCSNSKKTGLMNVLIVPTFFRFII